MSPLYMNARCRALLTILLTSYDHIPISTLAQELGVSKRTAYYDVYKVNLWLEQVGLSKLEVVRERGYLLQQESKPRVRELLEKDKAQQIYVFSPDERTKLIICYVIYSSTPVFLEQLTDCCGVSRNTIFGDLKEASRLLESYDLSIEYQAKCGYHLEGDEVRIRALFLLLFDELSELYRSETVTIFDRTQIKSDFQRLRSIQSALGVDYVDGILLALAVLLHIMRQRCKPLDLKGLKEDEISKTREFSLVNSHFPELVQSEQLYLTLHLLGSRVNMVPDELFESDSGEFVYDLTKDLVTEFEKVACIIFDRREPLERALFIHLNTSLYRFRYGIQIDNQLADDVMREYPNLFALSRIAASRLEKAVGTPIPDSEVAYLALHFGAFLRISERHPDRLRILIVCVNGISTGNMLKREIQKLLPAAEIVGVVASTNMVNVQDVCDLVISTVRINCIVPVITVHPVLTDFDRKAILNHRIVMPRDVSIQRETLFRVVRKYVSPKHYERLLQDLALSLQGGQEDMLMSAGEPGLLDVLDASRIKVIHEQCTWQQSIRKAGDCLLESHSIELHYLETIISQLLYYGPYMFLMDDVILAHAKPEDGVSCLDLSVAIFNKPVVFSNERKARLVMVLAAEDQEKHLGLLQDILLLVSQPNTIERLVACESGEEALLVIGKIMMQSQCDHASE